MANLAMHNPTDTCLHDTLESYNFWWENQAMEPYYAARRKREAEAAKTGVIIEHVTQDERLRNAQQLMKRNRLNAQEFASLRAQACGEGGFTVTPIAQLADEMESLTLAPGNVPTVNLGAPQGQLIEPPKPPPGVGFQQVPAPSNGAQTMTNGGMVPTNGNGYPPAVNGNGNGNGPGILAQFKTAPPWMQVVVVGGGAAIVALVARALMPKKKGRR